MTKCQRRGFEYLRSYTAFMNGRTENVKTTILPKLIYKLNTVITCLL